MKDAMKTIIMMLIISTTYAAPHKGLDASIGPGIRSSVGQDINKVEKSTDKKPFKEEGGSICQQEKYKDGCAKLAKLCKSSPDCDVGRLDEFCSSHRTICESGDYTPPVISKRPNNAH